MQAVILTDFSAQYENKGQHTVCCAGHRSTKQAVFVVLTKDATGKSKCRVFRFFSHGTSNAKYHNACLDKITDILFEESVA